MEPAEVLATRMQATNIAVRLPRCLDGVNVARVVSNRRVQAQRYFCTMLVYNLGRTTNVSLSQFVITLYFRVLGETTKLTVQHAGRPPHTLSAFASGVEAGTARVRAHTRNAAISSARVVESGTVVRSASSKVAVLKGCLLEKAE